jgi:accessory colonization factor AcfC
MILAILAMAGPAAAETIQLYAAGSLKAALTDVSKAYETSTGSQGRSQIWTVRPSEEWDLRRHTSGGLCVCQHGASASVA